MADLLPVSDPAPPSGDRLAWFVLGAMGLLFASLGVRILFGTDALADRIAGSVFTVAGLGMLGFSGWLRRTGLERYELRRRDPARPWHWRQAWLSGRIESDARRDNVTLWVFTVLWNLMSLPVWLGMAGAAIFFAWIFPAVGLVLAFVVVRASLRARHYGASTLIMQSVPGVLGGRLQGEVHATSALGEVETL
ncbi:MAG: hypothetical protein JRG83_20460, partial [Deltaproteobacteria bacterium]|nr:hypothetical protein [Deltaproteobacteria bacterium]